jgi:hypothetical protein
VLENRVFNIDIITAPSGVVRKQGQPGGPARALKSLCGSLSYCC